MAEEKKKCAYPACNCLVGKGKYCSQCCNLLRQTVEPYQPMDFSSFD